jgi:hypothetical protein
MNITESLLIQLVKSAYAEGQFDHLTNKLTDYENSIVKIAVDKFIKEETELVK